MASDTVDRAPDWKAGICDAVGTILPEDRLVRGSSNEVYCTVREDEFEPIITSLLLRKFALIGLFACEDFVPGCKVNLLYVFGKKGDVLILIRDATGPVSSLADRFPSASWAERECHDGFGISFTGSFDTRPLFLHETYPDGFYPLNKSFKNAPIAPKKTGNPADEYRFRTVEGEGVYQVPVGPVHAGIIEPGHFRFSVIGETIFNLEIRMFYKHRGIEKLAEGAIPSECVRTAEAVSGDESVANATGFCMGVERMSGIATPERAWYIRTILLEMERICSHLGDQAGMLTDVAFPLGSGQFSVLREEIFRENEKLTGSRFLRDMVVIGGISKDINNENLEAFRAFLEQFRKRYRVGLKIVLSTSSVIERFATTGKIGHTLINPLNLTGPSARASGGLGDVRLDIPYGIYAAHAPVRNTLQDGDVLSRFTIKAAEILDSIDLILRLTGSIPDGSIRSGMPVHDGYTLTLVESARGQNLCWIRILNGKIDRYKVRTASFCNWLAIEHAVQGNIIADFPVINKSLNLSYAGTDL